MRNDELNAWVKQVADHTRPAAIRWCNGSAIEARTWQGETSWNEIVLARFHKHLPQPLADEHRTLVERLRKARTA